MTERKTHHIALADRRAREMVPSMPVADRGWKAPEVDAAGF